MTTNKDEVLRLLECGQVVSGESISKKLNISRQAVLKIIKQLRDCGYNIEGMHSQGYFLKKHDILTKALINTPLPLVVLNSTSSTNDEAKKLFFSMGDVVVVANEQTYGKKKNGEVFLSPESSGIYMTIAKKVKLPYENFSLLRQKVAQKIADILQKVNGQKLSICNIDDIFINEKKACGIFYELMTNGYTNEICTIFLGIGIYTKDVGFGFIESEKSRNSIISNIISSVLEAL